MTSKPAETEGYLRLDYDEAAFLIPASQAGKIFLMTDARDLEAPALYCRRRTSYNGGDVPVFELSDFIGDHFHLPREALTDMAFMVPADRFDAARQARCRAALARAGLSDEFIAVAHGRPADMRAAPASEIRPLPRALAARLASRGIRACRFPRDSVIEYVLDITRVIMNHPPFNSE